MTGVAAYSTCDSAPFAGAPKRLPRLANWPLWWGHSADLMSKILPRCALDTHPFLNATICGFLCFKRHFVGEVV